MRVLEPGDHAWGGQVESLQGRCDLWSSGREGRGKRAEERGGEERFFEDLREASAQGSKGGGGSLKESKGGDEAGKMAPGKLGWERGEEDSHSQMLRKRRQQKGRLPIDPCCLGKVAVGSWCGRCLDAGRTGASPEGLPLGLEPGLYRQSLSVQVIFAVNPRGRAW